MNDSITAPTEGATEATVEATGPLTILPICACLLAMLALGVAACVFYRKRQQQLLTRQLRVTERRIHAVDSLKERKEHKMAAAAAAKAAYYPPSDVRASASEPSVTRPPHYFVRAENTASEISAPVAKGSSSIINLTACNCGYGDLDYCEACKERRTAHQPIRDRDRKERDASAGSLAVELATLPSLSSLATSHAPSRQTPAPPAGVRRTRSESSHHLPLRPANGAHQNPQDDKVSAWVAQSARSRHSLYPSMTPSNQPRPGAQQQTTGTDVIYTSPLAPAGRPNTPVSRSGSPSASEAGGTPGHAPDHTPPYTSDDALSEKWV